MTRSIRGILAPFVGTVGGLVVTIGIAGALGLYVDSATSIIPVILAFAVSIAYNIHLFSFFGKRIRLHGQRKRAVVETVKETWWPVFFCGCTTIVSLLPFLIVPIRPVAFIGIHTSLSVLFVMLTTMLVTPVLLSFGRDRRPKPNATEGGDSWGTRVMAQIGDFYIHHHKVILTLFVILCAGLAVGVSRVEPAFDMERTMGDKMATASLWVLVIAYAIVFSSKRVLSLFALRSNKAKMICADGIQECLETMRDIRANNAEDAYLAQLDKKNDNVERAAKRSEIASAVFVISASMILKLGIASTALVGENHHLPPRRKVLGRRQRDRLNPRRCSRSTQSCFKMSLCSTTPSWRTYA